VLSVINIPLLSVVQAKVPARLMGRVMSVFLSLVLVAAPFGAFFAGSLAAATSIGFVYLAAGVLVIVVAGIGFLLMRELRNLTY
jgi:dipeptide/tripeptide permease